jgi:mRNA interferase MazF
MKQAGQIVLFHFPQTDLAQSKSRPALLLGRLPGKHDNWLICMISTQSRQAVPHFDEMIQVGDEDFPSSGLKSASVIRLGRLAVVEGGILMGAIGQVSVARLRRLKGSLAAWLDQ